jgi:hypothetical protein
MENKETKNEVMLESASKILKIDQDNSKFFLKNGFLALTLCVGGEEKNYDRAFLHRDFPHELLWEYISVMGDDGKEIGLIYSIDDFDADTTQLLKTEIERKYYSPCIAEIYSLKERYGFSYWNVRLEDGREQSFTMQDTFRNIIHSGEDSAILVDVDGNRYGLKSISELDRKSYRKIELYL